MRPGLLFCGLLCAGIHLVLARTFRQRSQTNNGLELSLSKRNVYMPSWYALVFLDLRYSVCSNVQAVTAESWRFKSRFGLPTICPILRHYCEKIVRDKTAVECQISIVATEVASICNCATPVVVVNGNWGEWSDAVYDLCSVSCGIGTESYTRTRLCNNPAPSYGGAHCVGDNAIGPYTRSCSRPACTNEPVNGGWSAWSETQLSACTVTCGGGTEVFSLSRECNNPTPARGGEECQGQATGTRTDICNTQTCINDGSWGAFGAEVAVTTCTATCGGGQRTYRRTRACDSPAPSPGGQDCVGSATSDVIRTCNEQTCPNDGSWGAWGAEVAVTTCTATCGGGQRTYRRTRACDSPAPSPGGQDCVGSATSDVIRTCNEQLCPIDGMWGAWTAVSTTACTVSCGGGTQTRTDRRLCDSPAQANGGLPCSGNNERNVPLNCNTDDCTVIQDGGWSPWVDVPETECTTPCGGGRQNVTRTRTCTNPVPINGQPCTGSATGNTFEKACNAEDAQICPQAACLTSRIVGGNNVDPACKYPFVVGVRRFGAYSCGGSLIGLNKVLTAAHCVVGLQASSLSVEVGKHCSSTSGSASYNSRNPNMEVMEVEEFVIHPNFNSGSGLLFDAAVLKLKKDAITTKCRQVIQMAPSSQVTQTGRTCTVIGWGTTSYNGPAASILQEVDLELYDSQTCRDTFPSTASGVDNNVICAANGVSGGEDACQGDSGGPLVCLDDNVWVQYGIVSSGFECARANQAGLYTEVAAFRTWIDSQFV
ncbi:semaphorin-5B-like isoform X1 [Haliotis cracherodii]|uniref:semaphorin-5B-like isoform X1 n=1 Tax=Haliotis cracherodii TaxID=6455 RepID=UPI0039E954D4